MSCSRGQPVSGESDRLPRPCWLLQWSIHSSETVWWCSGVGGPCGGCVPTGQSTCVAGYGWSCRCESYLIVHSKTCLFDLPKRAWLTQLKWHSEELFPVPYKNEQHGFGWKSRLGVECPVYQSHSRCHKSSLSLEHVHSLLHFLYIIITSFSDGLLKLCQICFQCSW